MKKSNARRQAVSRVKQRLISAMGVVPPAKSGVYIALVFALQRYAAEQSELGAELQTIRQQFPTAQELRLVERVKAELLKLEDSR